jgi:hypothetical protein
MRTSTKKPRFSRVGWLALPVLAVVLLLPAAPAFAAEPCPNEQLRVEDNSTSLPDCRAYEQVSPVLKEGNPFEVKFITENGESVAMDSYGAVSGSPGRYVIQDAFLAQRSGSGWETTSLDPSEDEFPPSGANELDSTPDLLGQVWLSGGGPEKEGFEFWVRQPDGRWAGSKSDLAGPQGGAPQYLGGSSNLSDLIFQAAANVLLSPADKVVTGFNLYEITGAGTGSPTLSFVPVEDSGNALSTTTAAELGSGGHAEETHQGSEWHAISRNGSKVFFDVAPSSSSYNGDTDTQVFARIENKETVDLSEPLASECSACLETAPKADEFVGASEEGSKVFFTTAQELLSGQSTNNIYEYDFEEPIGHRIVLGSTGTTKPEVLGVTRISNDGSHVYFVAAGVLTSVKNNAGQEAKAGADNFYVVDTETHETKFIADLCSGPGKSDTLADTQCPAASTETDSALWSTTDRRPAQATPEKRYLVFTSVGDLTAGDTSTVAQVFRYDAETGELVRVSTGENGYDDNGNTTTNPASINSPYSGRTANIGGAEADFENSFGYQRAISADGSYVVFSTTEALSPRDTNHAKDAYEWHDNNVSLISDGKDPAGSEFQNMSSNASNIFFFTQDSLVGQDTGSGDEDIYDAHIDGGFPAPTPPPSPGCSGEPCQGPLSSPFSPPGPVGSSTQAAGENAVAPTTTTTTTTKPKALTKAQKLAKALKQCKKDKSKTKRTKCKKEAKKKYGTKAKQKAKK